MALAAVQMAANIEGKSLHPFFSNSSGNHNQDQPTSANSTPVDNRQEELDGAHNDSSLQADKGRGKRSKKIDAAKGKKKSNSVATNQPSLDHFTQPLRAHAAVGSTHDGEKSAQPLEDVQEEDRRKRRKTVSPAPPANAANTTQALRGELDWCQQLQAEAGQMRDADESPDTVPEAVPTLTAPIPEVVVTSANPVVHEPKQTTPKKQIKVTKTGRLLSSPPRSTPEPKPSPKKKRVRRSGKPTSSPTVTIIKYGSDTASRSMLGRRIEDILQGRSNSSTRPPISKRLPTKPVGPPRATHPFFTGKSGPKKDVPSAKTTEEQQPPTPRKSAVTPGKLRSEALKDRLPASMSNFDKLPGNHRLPKQSGLSEAAWPTRETVHVRSIDDASLENGFTQPTPEISLVKRRKMKNNIISLPADQEIISRLATDLSRYMRQKQDVPVSQFEPPQDVRLPRRLLTTGIEIQRRVRDQLQSGCSGAGEHQRIHGVHPAVNTVFDGIERTLTPFDEGKCDSQAWCQKYSPQCASHVLSIGPEADLLKDWLQNLTVMAVGGAFKSTSVLDVKKPPKKKRKKDFNDFIVSDDEEQEEEMVEVLGHEDTSRPRPSHSLRQPRWTRNKNVVLISGPHGCGKSATVYAVAKELGFEVFEINPGVRRAGKDIQDKVGDMTGNHLVSHNRSVTSLSKDDAPHSDAEGEQMDTALRKDLDSGRQGTMTAFFQTKAVAGSHSSVKAKIREAPKSQPSAPQTTLPLAPAVRKSQKQSLILFEEADILFEDDQQFWAQVAKLASQSKRPIVITCNDEQQIPMHELPLAAILRLEPPPVELATNYMLVVAGKEGHILERDAVSDLYRSKKMDLRASIAELNLWCQMSVGDRKGGLEWIYQRWPPGKDVDENGRLIRVASEGTYQSGMGWLPHNTFETNENVAFDKTEELLKNVWQDWGVVPTQWQASATGRSASISTTSEDERLKILAQFDAFSESRSAADIYCSVGLPTYDQNYHEPTDATLPPITSKARLNYTLVAPVLQVDHQSDFLNFDRNILTQTHLLIERAYPEVTHCATHTTSSPALSETQYAKAILAHKDHKDSQHTLSRLDFAAALDILAAPPDATLIERTSYNLTASSFDRTFSIITLDLAPYVRSMVAHEQILEAQRIRLSNLLSAGGTGKRPRTTRASRTALEGGFRETKRRDRWFDKDLNFELVMRTAGKEWAGMGWRGEGDGIDGTASVTATQESSEGAFDVEMQGVQE